MTDKVKLYRICTCHKCYQSFRIDTQEFMKKSNTLHQPYCIVYCPGCENNILVFKEELEQLPTYIISED